MAHDSSCTALAFCIVCLCACNICQEVQNHRSVCVKNSSAGLRSRLSVCQCVTIKATYPPFVLTQLSVEKCFVFLFFPLVSVSSGRKSSDFTERNTTALRTPSNPHLSHAWDNATCPSFHSQSRVDDIVPCFWRGWRQELGTCSSLPVDL